jgi:hypothetical protein
MLRFMLRHFTGILVLAAVAAWAIFYLPYTPTWAVLQMKRAVDARDGQEAARYIDFDSVVRHAGQEMVQKRGGGDPLSTVLGNAAIDLFIKPLSQLVQSWAVKKVDDGAKEVQMPGAAVVGSLVLMHRNGDTAYTNFKDARTIAGSWSRSKTSSSCSRNCSTTRRAVCRPGHQYRRRRRHKVPQSLECERFYGSVGRDDPHES